MNLVNISYLCATVSALLAVAVLYFVNAPTLNPEGMFEALIVVIAFSTGGVSAVGALLFGTLAFFYHQDVKPMVSALALALVYAALVWGYGG